MSATSDGVEPERRLARLEEPRVVQVRRRRARATAALTSRPTVARRTIVCRSPSTKASRPSGASPTNTTPCPAGSTTAVTSPSTAVPDDGSTPTNVKRCPSSPWSSETGVNGLRRGEPIEGSRSASRREPRSPEPPRRRDAGPQATAASVPLPRVRRTNGRPPSVPGSAGSHPLNGCTETTPGDRDGLARRLREGGRDDEPAERDDEHHAEHRDRRPPPAPAPGAAPSPRRRAEEETLRRTIPAHVGRPWSDLDGRASSAEPRARTATTGTGQHARMPRQAADADPPGQHVGDGRAARRARRVGEAETQGDAGEAEQDAGVGPHAQVRVRGAPRRRSAPGRVRGGRSSRRRRRAPRAPRPTARCGPPRPGSRREVLLEQGGEHLRETARRRPHQVDPGEGHGRSNTFVAARRSNRSYPAGASSRRQPMAHEGRRVEPPRHDLGHHVAPTGRAPGRCP